MRRYPASREYAPTMVANGSKRHPLHSHYRRIHRNGDDADDVESYLAAEEGPSGAAVEEVTISVPSSSGKKTGKKGRPAMSPSAKARAKEKREAEKAAGGTEEKKKRKLTSKQAAEKAVIEAFRKALAKAGGAAPSKSSRAAGHIPAIKIQYVGGGESGSTRTYTPSQRKAIGERLKAGKAAKKAGATVTANPFRLFANGRGRKPLSESEKNRRANLSKSQKKAEAAARKEAREAKLAAMTPSARAAAEKRRAAAAGKKIGPYKISILKNPVTDFEIGGVKVVPALAGAAGAVALSQLVRNLPFVANMQAGIVKDLLPAATVVAAGVAGLYYADKNKNSGMLKDLSKDMTAFGMFLGLNDVVGSKIRDMVDNLKGKPAAVPAAGGTSGGAFFNGGGWMDTEQLSGYHMSGSSESGYPPAFALTGGEGYFVPSGLALNGYHLAGDANSAATAAAITALNGGQYRESAIGGIDLNGYQD